MERLQENSGTIVVDPLLKEQVLLLAKAGKYGEAALFVKEKILPTIAFMSFDSDDGNSWLSSFLCGMSCCNCCEEGSNNSCVAIGCLAFCLVSCICGSDKAFKICGIEWACDCCCKEAGCHS